MHKEPSSQVKGSDLLFSDGGRTSSFPIFFGERKPCSMDSVRETISSVSVQTELENFASRLNNPLELLFDPQSISKFPRI